MSPDERDTEPVAEGAAETAAPEAPAAGDPATGGDGDPAAADAAGTADAPPVPDGEHATADGPGAAGESDPGAEDAAPVEADLDELTAATRQRDEYLALAQRTQADFENYRKRMQREVRAAEDRGVRRLVEALLPALDDLERALAHAGTETTAETEQVVSGVRLVEGTILKALERHGIERFSPSGERFDPEQHEAMVSQPVEGAESGTVVEVFQQGYRLGEAVIRPARVVVAS